MVFEIISESTSRTERIEKLREYQATASIQGYVILEQDSIAAMVFARHGSDWTAYPLTENDVLNMPEIGVAIRPADIYADVELAPPGDAGDAPPAD